MRTMRKDDSQKKIDEDVKVPYTEYFLCGYYYDCDKCPSRIDGKKPNKFYGCLTCGQAMMYDLLRRQRELDEQNTLLIPTYANGEALKVGDIVENENNKPREVKGFRVYDDEKVEVLLKSSKKVSFWTDFYGGKYKKHEQDSFQKLLSDMNRLLFGLIGEGVEGDKVDSLWRLTDRLESLVNDLESSEK